MSISGNDGRSDWSQPESVMSQMLTSDMGQNPKYSTRENLFRLPPDSGNSTLDCTRSPAGCGGGGGLVALAALAIHRGQGLAVIWCRRISHAARRHCRHHNSGCAAFGNEPGKRAGHACRRWHWMCSDRARCRSTSSLRSGRQSDWLRAASLRPQGKSGCNGCGKVTRRANHQKSVHPFAKKDCA
jgi:hypothetical protein